MYRAFATVFENFRISDISLRNGLDDDIKVKLEDGSLNLTKVPKIDLDDELDEVFFFKFNFILLVDNT